MRTLTFVSSLDYSVGAAPQNRHLAYWRALVRGGVGVRVLLTKAFPTAGHLPDGECYPEFLPFGGARLGVVGARPLGLLDAIQSTIRTIRSQPGDAVILLDSNPVLLSALLPAARKSGVPVLHERTELPSALRRSATQRLLGMHYDRSQLGQMDGLYAITKPLLNLLMHQGSVQHGRVVNMIVDPARFPGPIDAPSGPPTIAYVGGLDAAKDGLPDLVRAFGRLAGSGRLPAGARLTVAGSGSRRQRAELEGQIASSGAPEKSIRLLGYVPRAAVPRLLADSTVLALPRPNSPQARYGFPTKLGEYLASGRPVVATRVGELPAYLQDGLNAYLADAGDIHSLSGALEMALTDPRANEVGAAGRELALSVFSPDRAASQILGLLEDCLR